jgi:prepilin-type processing-associated H-X9-DG protein
MNEWMYDSPKGGKRGNGYWRTIEAVREPTETPLMADCKWRGGFPGHKPDQNNSKAMMPPDRGVDGRGDDPNKRENGYELANFAMLRHENKVAACFVDGSARSHKPSQLWAMPWSQNFDKDFGVQYLKGYGSRAAWMY